MLRILSPSIGNFLHLRRCNLPSILTASFLGRFTLPDACPRGNSHHFPGREFATSTSTSSYTGPNLVPPTGPHDYTAWELLQAKGRDGRTYSIKSTETLKKASQKFRLKRVGFLVVVDADNCFVGKIDTRDVLFEIARCSQNGEDWENVKVGDVMLPASKVVCVQPTDTARQCLSILAKSGFRKVPVIDTATSDDHETFIVGVLSYRDLVDAALIGSEYLVKDAKAQFINDIMPRTGVPKNTHVYMSPNLTAGPLYLDSAWANIPHPLKRDTGGEDAYFTLTAVAHANNNYNPALPYSVIAVADGVSSWKYEYDVDAGLFSRRLMSAAENLAASTLETSNDEVVRTVTAQKNLLISKDLARLTVVQLRNRLQELGLNNKGSKQVLFDRLRTHLTATDIPMTPATASPLPMLPTLPLPSCTSLLKHAWNTVRREQVAGSSTVCIATLHPRSRQDESNRLHIANVGDSGILLLRFSADASRYDLVYRTLPQLHEFDRPLQVGVDVDGKSSRFEQPSDASLVDVVVQEGDLVVMGSDGLFDNLSDENVVQIVEDLKIKEDAHYMEQLNVPLSKVPIDHINPELIAKTIADQAYEMSIQKKIDSPFAILAKDNMKMYSGGRKDDITVIAARVKRGGAAPLRKD